MGIISNQLDTNHAFLSPSSAFRWTKCPASAAYKVVGGPEAAEGTAAHERASQILKGITEDCGEFNIQTYIQAVKELIGELFVEYKLDLTQLIPNCWGTADAIVLQDNVAYVIDLKYGMDKVEAVNNKQLLLYAYGVLTNLKMVEKVNMVICQPRIYNVSTWTLTSNEIIAKCNQVAKQAQIATIQMDLAEDDRYFCPSLEGCKYCPHQQNCKALSLIISHEQMTSMTDKLSKAFMLKPWVENTLATAKTMLENGEAIPEYQLEFVRKGNMSWSDKVEDQVKEISQIGEEVYKKELLTPSQLKKKVSKETWSKLESLTTRGKDITAVKHI